MKVSFDVSRARPGAVAGVYPAKCATRTVLDHVTSKWGVLILLALQQDSLRWGELRRSIEGISEKMLASTLRTLESDGFVNREAQATIPPRRIDPAHPRVRRLREPGGAGDDPAARRL
ncbi:winged helix-turn-helix transcriptional regulator [Cryobacterium glucosi]|uniref:Transcriptional regulator n=1 Tax=Cryobacterium glucosi TaxID=1259175 RepID=A0ABY2IIM1_9MICO|nr:helix-turn-helix domain-containing protein [Cryobacterium glucosi]TFC17308.1 transcriptional regulator [Cryobacterium glucosi]